VTRSNSRNRRDADHAGLRPVHSRWPGSTGCANAGEVDILVNNAGAIPGGGLADVDDARWRQAWELKLFGYINLIRAVLPLMQARGSGVIANIIGMAGVAPRAEYICGSTANAALIAFTQAIGAASPQHGVRVFGINPSPTRSDRIEAVLRAQAASRFGDADRWLELDQEAALRSHDRAAGDCRPRRVRLFAALWLPQRQRAQYRRRTDVRQCRLTCLICLICQDVRNYSLMNVHQNSPHAYTELRDGVRAVVTQFDSRYWQEVDEARAFPDAFVKALTDAGWLSCADPRGIWRLQPFAD
jgi:NAD(P)-dependent dehydrogenase (short-subunit alcohol dehydrogenase family)